MPSKYEIGRQPCAELVRGRADIAANPHIANVHQCPTCYGDRTWCTACAMDHHEYGWESCTPAAYEPRDRCEECQWLRTCPAHDGAPSGWPAPEVPK